MHNAEGKEESRSQSFEEIITNPNQKEDVKRIDWSTNVKAMKLSNSGRKRFVTKWRNK